MATIINNPGETSTGSDSAAGLVIGIIVALLLIVLFFVYGLPAIRSSPNNTSGGAPAGSLETNTSIDVNLPPGGSGNNAPPAGQQAPATP